MKSSKTLKKNLLKMVEKGAKGSFAMQEKLFKKNKTNQELYEKAKKLALSQ